MRTRGKHHDTSAFDGEDEVDTRVYFEPGADTIPGAEPTTAPLPAQAAIQSSGEVEAATRAYQRPPARSFEVSGSYQVTPIAPRAVPALAPPAVAQRGHYETKKVMKRQPARRSRGIVFAVACVLIGIGIGGAIAVNGASRWRAEAAATEPKTASAAPAAAAVPTAPASPIVTPIEQPAPPAPTPTNLPPPTPTITAPAPTVVEPAPAVDPAPVVPAPAHDRHHAHHAAQPTGDTDEELGKLDISAKPPCAITIDGKATGLVTPQRSIELRVGRHSVTLTNGEQGIQLTAEVVVSADRPAQLIQDFTK
jgi:hypothetical protein